MEATLVERIETSCLCQVPAAVGVYKGVVVVATPACCTREVGLPKEAVNLRFYQLHGSAKYVHLKGHSSQVNVLAFSSNPATFLCSSSEDEILLWHLDHCNEEHDTTGSPYGCLQLDPPSNKESINHLCFNQDSLYVAVCRGQKTLIFNTKTCLLDTTLLGHTARVTCAVFSPHCEQSTIITASEDRTFKIWDLSNSSLIYQSPVISVSPFLCVTVALHNNLLATGTADGMLRIFDLSEGPGRYTCLHKCDVAKELKKFDKRNVEDSTQPMDGNVIQSTPSWRMSCDDGQEKDHTSVEVGPTILDLYYWPQEQQEQPSLQISVESHVREVLREPPILLVATHCGLVQFNGHTLQLVDAVHFKEPLKTSQQTGSAMIPAIATCDFVYNSLEGEVYCTLGAMFNGSVMLVSLNKGLSKFYETTALELGNTTDEEHTGGTVVSVLSSTPLVQNSPLRAEFSLKNQKTASKIKKSSASQVTHPTKTLHDQPLTFKSKIKSSGYSEAPRMKMFSVPKAITHSHKSAPGPSHSNTDKKKNEYPVLCDPTVHPFYALQLSERHSAVYHSCFNGNGQYLTCASADKVAYVVKMPAQSDKIRSFVGHDGAVLSTSWSHSGEWLLTSSTDRTARVWTIGHKDPLLTIDTISHNFKSAEKETKSNLPFSREISCGQFYYLDKFFLLTSGNSLYLYKYHIDTTKPDDVKRYQTNSRYKLVSCITMESAQSITAMSSINDFHSYIVLVGGSNKMLEVYDMNVERSIRTMTEMHSRPVHCISQNQGSKYVTHPPAAYDLFLTSAIAEGIKLWDLRTNRCIHKFSSHSNPSLPVSATISPCARFIATGSEDRAAYIYDIRSVSPLHKLRGYSDAVSCVTYHPMKPVLATSTLDGQVRLFADKV